MPIHVPSQEVMPRVLRAIVETPGTSRDAIAREANLSQATLTQYTKRLQNEAWVFENGTSPTKGPPSKKLFATSTF